MKKYEIFSAFVTMLVFVSCTKSDDCQIIAGELNDLTCEIDGIIWKPKLNSFIDLFTFDFPLSARYREFDNSTLLMISAHREDFTEGCDTIDQTLKLRCKNPKPGLNELSSIDTGFYDYQKDSCILYSLDTLQTNFINISKMDSLIVGTFEFIAIDECFNLLHITNGQIETPLK